MILQRASDYLRTGFFLTQATSSIDVSPETLQTLREKYMTALDSFLDCVISSRNPAYCAPVKSIDAVVELARQFRADVGSIIYPLFLTGEHDPKSASISIKCTQSEIPPDTSVRELLAQGYVDAVESLGLQGHIAHANGRTIVGINGPYATGLLRSELGIHKVNYSAQALGGNTDKMLNTFMSVAVIPEGCENGRGSTGLVRSYKLVRKEPIAVLPFIQQQLMQAMTGKPALLKAYRKSLTSS